VKDKPIFIAQEWPSADLEWTTDVDKKHADFAWFSVTTSMHFIGEKG
jgi:hypothetical protein